MRFIEYHVHCVNIHGDIFDTDVSISLVEARKYFRSMCEEITLPVDPSTMDDDDIAGIVLEKLTTKAEKTLMWYGDASLMGGWAAPAEAFYDPLKQLLAKAKSRTKKGVGPVKAKP